MRQSEIQREQQRHDIMTLHHQIKHLEGDTLSLPAVVASAARELANWRLSGSAAQQQSSAEGSAPSEAPPLPNQVCMCVFTMLPCSHSKGAGYAKGCFARADQRRRGRWSTRLLAVCWCLVVVIPQYVDAGVGKEPQACIDRFAHMVDALESFEEVVRPGDGASQLWCRRRLMVIVLLLEIANRASRR